MLKPMKFICYYNNIPFFLNLLRLGVTVNVNDCVLKQ